MYAAHYDRYFTTAASYVRLADVRLSRALAVAVLFSQFLLACVSGYFRSLLFADGSFFTFVIAADNPWGLHWHNFLVRVSAYLVTVLPVLTISRDFDLTGDSIAHVYSLVFYLVPFIQYCIIAALGWRRLPSLLIFPIIDFTFAVGPGYGFPSEMTLASGFFWIGMFLASQRRPSLALIYLSFLALLFLHELAVPAALLIPGYLFLATRREKSGVSRGQILFYLGCAIALGVWAVIKFGGFSSGGDTNIIRSLDPRKLLGTPSLWCVVAAAAVAIAVMRLSGWKRWLIPAGIIVCVTAAYSLLHYTFIDGRYESARTAMAGSMLVLGGIFIALRLRGSGTSETPGGSVRDLVGPPADYRVLGIGLAAALAANVATTLMCLHQTLASRAVFESHANAAMRAGSTQYISISDLTKQEPASAAALLRVDFSWTWPFTAIMTAENLQPAQVIFDPVAIPYACVLLQRPIGPAPRIPAATLEGLKNFACAQPVLPPPDTLSTRIERQLRGH
jgi:hypothetical protein